MRGRDGSISMIRVGLLAAIFGVLVIVVGIISFFVDRASHQVPYEVEPYPNAVSWGQTQRSQTSRSVYFQIPNTSPEDVTAYYQRKMNEFYGNNADQELSSCKRSPVSGNFPDFTQGVPNTIPYQYICLFDRSGFFITQYTKVIIQPGIPATNTQGMTVVEHDQVWQR